MTQFSLHANMKFIQIKLRAPVIISKETEQGNFTLKVIEYVTVVVDAVVEREDSIFAETVGVA